MSKIKTFIDANHPYWEILKDTGHPEASAILYHAEIIKGLTEAMWKVAEELRGLEEEKEKPPVVSPARIPK